MLFNSYIFILVFLPIVLILYYMLAHYEKKTMLLTFLSGVSFGFYGYSNPSYLLILIVSICVNWLFSSWILKEQSKSRKAAKILLICGISFNICLIFYFKYRNFFVENWNLLFQTDFELQHIVMPLGISFFTFQQISYLVDSFRGETKEYQFIEYCAFVSFFPQLVAGPIVLHNELMPQFRNVNNYKVNWENMANGIFDFSVGLFKKVIIADTFGKAVSTGLGMYENANLTTLEIIIVVIFYTFQIYFDFSGYCDMAIGIGRMFNMELPANFNCPYKACSVLEFWERWHMSLTRFLRTYIYFPLGGGRRGKICKYRNVMIVFLISGFWHGAGWNFIIWGALHGAVNVLNRIFLDSWNRVHKIIRWTLTFLFINFSWLIFRVESLELLRSILQDFSAMIFVVREETWKIITEFNLIEFRVLEKKILGCSESMLGMLNMMIFLVFSFVYILRERTCKEIKVRPTFRYAVSTVLLLMWSVFSLSEISEFLYFNF